MSRFPFLPPKKLMKATGRYLSPPILSSSNFPRPLTYILIANNLNQTKSCLHNHARSFMTCIFLTNGTIHFNPLIFPIYHLTHPILPRLLEDTHSLAPQDAPPQHHIPYPSLRSQTTIHPSQAYCLLPQPRRHGIHQIYKQHPQPKPYLSRPINPSLSNSIKASNHYQLSLLLLELQQDIATMAAPPPLPTQIHPYSTATSPLDIDPKPYTPISLFNPI
ncbi:hypothetical protein PAPYR_13075 [Paratrimastix pyriformis]|uniref:Uncharacterized protein n=1 Tax=Paratrimastix pyriformis TaxID=342808 RepID=A0ABQ8U4H4_9EUKA|nr:hypothetical protein PAPYR_13075 [Paratrimastix pyriformis]